jgi:hypothetical protein
VPGGDIPSWLGVIARGYGLYLEFGHERGESIGERSRATRRTSRE